MIGEPKLAAPGAGLPKPELLVARFLFRRRLKAGSREVFNEKFQNERAAIAEIVRSIGPELASKRVLIDRVRGLEDSSRFWSVYMTLEHLRMVNSGIAMTVRNLGAGKQPPGKVDTAAVKPRPDVSGAVVAEYENACDAALAAVASVADLKTSLSHAHPWFGPLDAFGWHCLAAGHMNIHRQQMELIVAQFR